MEKDFFNEMEKQREMMHKLTADREAFRNLIEAYVKEDYQKFTDILKKLQIFPYCWWLCKWICYMRCEWRCHMVCPPLAAE